MTGLKTVCLLIIATRKLALYAYTPLYYLILLIIRYEKLLLFHVFNFIPQKTFMVTNLYKLS